MNSFFLSAGAFLLAIGVLVAVHEFGHFIVARMLGVKVLRFCIGFGRPLWIYRAGRDATEYCVATIPFGGYVKLLDERDCAVTLAEQGRAFNRQSVPARVAILAAGPVLNFIFAVLAYWVMFMAGVPGSRPIIGEVAPHALADRAGLVSGDEIIRIGSRSTATWESAIVAMLDELLASGRITLEVRRPGHGNHTINLSTAGQEARLTEPGQLFTGLGFRPWVPRLPPVIGEITPGGAAARAGLQRGDLVLRAADRTIGTWPEWVEFVRQRPGTRVEVTVQRRGNPLVLPLEIERNPADRDKAVGRIGAGPEIPAGFFDRFEAVERYGATEAFLRAGQRTWDMGALTVRMVARMVTGDVSVRNISGPINIAQYAGYSASAGLASFLSFLAVVSVSLGILNLLPVPMLDGGQIVYQLAEAAKGQPLSERIQLIGQQVGILFLLLLMSFAVYNDLSRLLG